MNKIAVANDILKLAKKLSAGTWALPTTPAAARQVISVLKALDNTNWPTGENPVTKALSSVLGDDQLFDEIDNAADKYLAACAYAIKRRVKQLAKEGMDAAPSSRAYEIMKDLAESL